MRRHWLLCLLPLCIALSACSPTTTRVGDLGRPVDLERTGAIPEKFIARSGTAQFNETGEERAMADRLWRFLHAPHVAGWFIPTLPREPVDGADDPGRYYRWLQKTRYRSAEGRYNTVSGDIHADLLTLPATFEAICAVDNINRQRGIALSQVGEVESGMAERVAAQRSQNDASIAAFSVALRYRHDSYRYALDNLLVETPNREAVDADRLLIDLSRRVGEAEAGDFCQDRKTTLILPG